MPWVQGRLRPSVRNYPLGHGPVNTGSKQLVVSKTPRVWFIDIQIEIDYNISSAYKAKI